MDIEDASKFDLSEVLRVARNLRGEDKTMAYGEYKGRCVGRLLHFLYRYNHNADVAIFHDPKHDPMITLWNKPFANYTWDGDTDVPTFTFLGDFKHFAAVQEREKPRLLEHCRVTTETELREAEEAREQAFKEKLRRQIKESVVKEQGEVRQDEGMGQYS